MAMSVILLSVDFDGNRDMILPALASGIMIIILLSIAWSMRLPRSHGGRQRSADRRRGRAPDQRHESAHGRARQQRRAASRRLGAGDGQPDGARAHPERVIKTSPNKAANNSRISFVYGNLKIENELITREMVEKASEIIDEKNNEGRN